MNGQFERSEILGIISIDDVVGYTKMQKSLGLDLEFVLYILCSYVLRQLPLTLTLQLGGNASAVPAWLTTIALSQSCLGLARPRPF